MRFIIGLVLIAHGLAHSMGFVIPWRIGRGKNAPYNTTTLSGFLDLGDLGIRAMGILWAGRGPGLRGGGFWRHGSGVVGRNRDS